MRQIPGEDLGRFESVVGLVREELGQPLESRTHGEPRVKGRKAGGLGAGAQLRADGYGHVMARIRERLRER